MSKQPTRGNGPSEAKALQAFLNKREAIAVQVLASLAQNPNIIDNGFTLDPEDVAGYAVEMADELLKKLYVHKDTPEKE